MKNSLVSVKYVPLALAVMAAVVCALLLAGSATAGITPPPFLTGMVGVTSSQAPRFNAVNVGNASASVELLLLDAASNVLNHGSFVLQPGQAVSISTTATQGYHGLIRAQLNVQGSTNGELVPAVIPTLELVEVATGKTDLVITDVTQKVSPARQ